MLKFQNNKLNLESLDVLRIQDLNKIIGGDSGMGMDEAASTCRCVKYSGCSIYRDSEGNVAMTGGTWYED